MTRIPQIVNKSLRSEKKPSIKGYLEIVDSLYGLTGWIVDESDLGASLILEIWLDGRSVGITAANQERSDVATALSIGMNSGFQFDWSVVTDVAAVSPVSGSILEIRLKNTGETLSSLEIPVPQHVVTLREAMRFRSTSGSQPVQDQKLIAFYLPQYHPIPENDRWWGEGFTEWHNVTSAQSQFPNHYQPHLPADLGYYDLRLPEVREKQAALAKQYGIHGFCYYFYWFSGKRLLERPLNEVLQSRMPEFPFCICWANETWSRRWDGSEHEILMQQVHDPATDIAFIRDVLPILKDSRYIRVAGKPLLIVYRASLLSDPVVVADAWRVICKENGIPEVHLCMVESFQHSTPAAYGFDSSLEFPPHNNPASGINHRVDGLSPEFRGEIFDYAEFVGKDLEAPTPPYKRFKGVMLGWDNTARRGRHAKVFINASPLTYEIWLNGAMAHTAKHLPTDHQFVFINAWNEWAEGTHLEPDRRHGRQYLEATLRAVSGKSAWKVMSQAVEHLTRDNPAVGTLVQKANAEILLRDRVIAHLRTLIRDQGPGQVVTRLLPTQPVMLDGEWIEVDPAHGQVERVNALPFHNVAYLDRGSGLQYLAGWFVVPNVEVGESSSFWLVAEAIRSGKRYFAFVGRRVPRSDVSAHGDLAEYDNSRKHFSGFSINLDISRLDEGSYRCRTVTCRPDGNHAFSFEGEFNIV